MVETNPIEAQLEAQILPSLILGSLSCPNVSSILQLGFVILDSSVTALSGQNQYAAAANVPLIKSPALRFPRPVRPLWIDFCAGEIVAHAMWNTGRIASRCAPFARQRISICGWISKHLRCLSIAECCSSATVVVVRLSILFGEPRPHP